MQRGNMKSILEIDPIFIGKRYPGVNIELLVKVVNKLNEIIKDRVNPFYLFINPHIEIYSKEWKLEPKKLLKILLFLKDFRSDDLKMEAVLQIDEENLFYVLQQEDLEELKEYNIVSHPDDPKIKFDNADEIIRHAFVLGHLK